MPQLPALLVKNRVIWVNPNFDNLPFDFKVGEPSELGIFLTHAPNPSHQHMHLLEIDEDHKRSAVILKKEIKDKDGNIYTIIDAKGIGYVKGPPRIQERYGSILPTSVGIFDKADAELDAKMSELFHGYGMKVSRALAIISLEEIVDGEGERISIEEARKCKIILPESEPAIEIRVFGTRTRLQDVMNARSGTYDGEYDPKELVRKIGREVAIMHRNGWKHGVLTPHNIAIDGSLLDFDFASQGSDTGEDLKQIEQTLYQFFGSNEYTPLFYESYGQS